MYDYISGKIVDKTLTSVVVDNNGIGYDIGVSGNTLSCVDVGENVKIYTYLYVKEDEMSLYGFAHAEEKRLFLKLISISGIGPKLAMQILSGYDLHTLTVAIASGDVKTLCKIKGLGKKTAELIVLNLREATQELVSFNGAPSAISLSDDVQEAIFALESLGMSRSEAMTKAADAKAHVNGTENIIAYCLKNMGTR